MKSSEKSLQECIQNCQKCHTICLETLHHCTQKGGEHVTPDHLSMLLDCAQICETSADFMLRHSQFHSQTCEVCAEVCERCAEDCERFSGDSQMKACADICRRCAESCQELAGAKL
jgi:hypothetical protein